MAVQSAPPTYTLPATAFAVGVEGRVLRAGVDAGIVTLVGAAGRKRGGWRRAAAVDVVRIKAAVTLGRYGFSFAEADEILAATFDRRLGTLSVGTTFAQIITALQGARITVQRSRGRTIIGTARPAVADADHALHLDLEALARQAADGISAWRELQSKFTNRRAARPRMAAAQSAVREVHTQPPAGGLSIPTTTAACAALETE